MSSISYKRLDTGKSTILLMGVERFDMQHCFEVTENLKLLQPQCVISQLPSDHPMFINSKSSFLKTWEQFIKGQGGSFIIKPRPEFLQDIMLTQDSVSVYLRSVLLNSQEFCNTSANVVYSEHPSLYAKIRKSNFQPDCFMSALLFHANNTGKVLCSVVGDMPELVYRDNVVRKMSLRSMQEDFFQFFEEIENRNDDFDVRGLHPEVMLSPKAKYLAEIFKQISGTHNLVAAVVDINLIPLILQEWEALQSAPVDLKSFLTISEPTDNCTLVEYAEKHVLLDLMLGLFLDPYFMKFKFFPYTAVDILGSTDGIYEVILRAYSYYHQIHSTNLTNHINALISASHSGTAKNTSRESEKAEKGPKKSKIPKKKSSENTKKPKELSLYSDPE